MDKEKHQLEVWEMEKSHLWRAGSWGGVKKKKKVQWDKLQTAHGEIMNWRKYWEMSPEYSSEKSKYEKAILYIQYFYVLLSLNDTKHTE